MPCIALQVKERVFQCFWPEKTSKSQVATIGAMNKRNKLLDFKEIFRAAIRVRFEEYREIVSVSICMLELTDNNGSNIQFSKQLGYQTIQGISKSNKQDARITLIKEEWQTN